MTARALVDHLISQIDGDRRYALESGDMPKVAETLRGGVWLHSVRRWLRDDAVRVCGRCGAEFAGDACPCGFVPVKGEGN